MKKHKPRRDRRDNLPLRASLADRMEPGALSMLLTPTALPQMPRMPSPPRSTRDVLALLTAATGLTLAACPDAKVELLPGTPTTVIITNGGKAEAVFVLPVKPVEAMNILGQTEPKLLDMDMLQLWEETRQAEHITADTALMEAEENWLNGGYHEG